DAEGDDGQDQPAERCGLPVVRAPAAHAGGQVARLAAGGGAGGHGGSPFSGPRSGGVGEGAVEGVQCALGGDGEMEAAADPGVLDLEGQCVLARVPEQEDVESVALPGRELAGVVGVRDISFLLASMTPRTLGASRPHVAVAKSDSRRYLPTI